MGMLIPGRAVLRAGIAVPLLCVAAALMAGMGVHRVPQARRNDLSGRHGDPFDPRQSFRAYLYISRETRAWLAEQPAGRFEFTFTPKHGSWLNLVEGFFSKLARSVLRHIRVSS